MADRWLRGAILTSETINSLSDSAELFYRRLLSVHDDFGRFDARVCIVRVECYPLQVDRRREADISRWIAECETAGLIALYLVDGRPYGVVLKTDRPRAKRSRHPQPPDGVLCWREKGGAGVLQDTSTDSDTRERVRTHANMSEHMLPVNGERLTVNDERLTDERCTVNGGCVNRGGTDNPPPSPIPPNSPGFIDDLPPIPPMDRCRFDSVAIPEVDDYGQIAEIGHVNPVLAAMAVTRERDKAGWGWWVKLLSRNRKALGHRRADELFMRAVEMAFGEIRAGEAEKPGAILNKRLKEFLA